MKHYRQEQKIAKVVDSIICDKCGKEFSTDTMEGQLELQEFLFINFTGGYSSVFEDMAHIECDICQRCLKELLDVNKINYRVKGHWDEWFENAE